MTRRSAADIIAFWGEENLKRWKEEEIGCLGLPANVTEYLRDVGLPCREDWTLEFDSRTDALPFLPDDERYRVVGYDYVVPLCLDLRENCRIMSVDDDPDKVLFVNSGIEEFGEFLMLYGRYRRQDDPFGEEEALAFIEATEQEMRRSDPAALADAGCWWPLILEQMRDGFL
jgi:hypothetical protein